MAVLTERILDPCPVQTEAVEHKRGIPLKSPRNFNATPPASAFPRDQHCDRTHRLASVVGGGGKGLGRRGGAEGRQGSREGGGEGGGGRRDFAVFLINDDV